MAEPASRVRNAQGLWVWMDRYQPGLQARVRERLPPDIADVLDNGVRTAWIPLDRDRLFVHAVIDTLGREGAKQMWRRYAARYADESFIKPIFEATVRIFGLDVRAFCKSVVKIYRSEFRGMGDMDLIDQDDDSLVLMVTDVPAQMFERDAYIVMFEGMFTGMYDVAGIPDPRLSIRWDEDQGFVQIILEGAR